MKIKKFLAVLLAAVTCVMCMSFGAFAAEDEDEPSITLKKDSITMLLNGIYTLKYTVENAGKGAKISWSTSDKNIVTVGKGGVLTAKGVGTATVTVKIKDTDVSAECKVKVRAAKTTDELAKSMGTGYTIHNNLDVTGANWTTDITEWETAWGSPAISAKLMSTIKKAGFDAVTLNICWKDHIDQNGVIDEVWLGRVKECVDYAYDRGMYVIINTKDCWVSISEEKEYRKLYKAMWSQIAEYFADYDQRLIFQGLNQPTYADDQSGDKFPVSGRGVVNNLYMDFVKTVRAAGGNNKTRFLIVEPSDTYESLAVPNDKYVLVGVRPYFNGKKFDDNMKNDVDEEFARIKSCFIDKGYPVVITSWGDGDGDMSAAECKKFAEYFREKADELDIPAVWYDWTDYLLDRQTLKWKSAKLRDAVAV